MSVEEFRDALWKGKGRAVLHAQRCMRDELIEHIQEALTSDLSVDGQCEDRSIEYLLELAEAPGGLDRFRDAILGAFREATCRQDVIQLFALCSIFAEDGDRQ